jgi:voltage-gated potassium channel
MSQVDVKESRLKKWQEVSAWPIIVLSFGFIAVYVIPIYWYPLHPGLSTAFHVAEYVIWAVFIFGYAVQFQLAANKKLFFRHEWLRGIIFIRQATTRKKSLVRSLPPILASMAVLLVVISGAAVLSAERFAPHATITTPSDALWWALTEVTTAGGGNLSPVTVEGRLVAPTSQGWMV